MAGRVEEMRAYGPHVVVSHFPAFGIMDDEEFMHRGLRFLRNEIRSPSAPEWLLHGHLHRQEERLVDRTRVVQTFGTRVLEIP